MSQEQASCLSETGTSWPQYRSHKVVGALKLAEVMPSEVAVDYTTFVTVDGQTLTYSNEAECVKRCQAVEQRDPGYLIRYPDGFESWSPTEAFESGYNPETQTAT